MININGNPIDAAFEAQIQKRGEQFEARLGGEKRINQLFPRCPPPTSSSSSAAKGKPKSKKNSNTNANKKKSGGTGKKKTVSNKQQQPSLNERSVVENSISSSDPKVEIVDNIIDLSASGSNCDDVNRRNYIHHQQMISSNRHSSKTVLSPTTQEDVNLMVYNDNIIQVNENSETNLYQTNSEATFNTNIKVQHSSYSPTHLHSEQPGYYQQQLQPQQEQQFSTNRPNKYIDSYLDDNEKAVSSTNTTLRDSEYQATNYSRVVYQDSPPHVPSLESTNATHNISTLNQLPSTEISATSGGSNRSYQGTFSSMSGGTSGSSVGGHLDSVSDHSNSFPPSVGPTATPSSVTSYSYSSSAMMMSPGSSTASSSEHSAGGGNGGLARGVVTGSNSNTRYISGTVAAGNSPNIHGDNNSAKDQNSDQMMTAVNAGRIRKNLSEYSVSGVDNRISAASSTSSNITQSPMDTSVLKDTKIEIAGMPFIFTLKKFQLYD